MRVNSIPWWLWLAPIALLFPAIARMPYGYYTVTRIAVAGFACFLALVGWEDTAISLMWSAILGCVAVLFNPMIPIHLSRTTWHIFDVGVAIILTAHLVFVRPSNSS